RSRRLSPRERTEAAGLPPASPRVCQAAPSDVDLGAGQYGLYQQDLAFGPIPTRQHLPLGLVVVRIPAQQSTGPIRPQNAQILAFGFGDRGNRRRSRRLDGGVPPLGETDRAAQEAR